MQFHINPRMADISDEVAAIPMLKTNAGPRDTENWGTRVKEEYIALIQYIKQNKDRDNDWFKLESNRYAHAFKSTVFDKFFLERVQNGGEHVGISMSMNDMNLR